MSELMFGCYIHVLKRTKKQKRQVLKMVRFQVIMTTSASKHSQRNEELYTFYKIIHTESVFRSCTDV